MAKTILFLNIYFPFGGLFPLPPPEGFPVVLGAFGGLFEDFDIIYILINGYGLNYIPSEMLYLSNFYW